MTQTTMTLTEERPRLRGRLHQVAFFVTIPAGLLLIAVAPGSAARLGAAIYTLTLLALFGASASYHLGEWSERARARMRRLDHSMIFVLIAGTYTPYCITGDRRHDRARDPGAGVGRRSGGRRDEALPGRSARGVGLHVRRARLAGGRRLPVAGCAGSPTCETALIVAGGLLYSVGALALATNMPDPWPRTFGYHEVWHAATVAAAASFYLAILLVYLSA